MNYASWSAQDAPELPTKPLEIEAKTHTGATRMNEDGTVSTLGNNSWSATDQPPGNLLTDSPFATAKNKWGQAVPYNQLTGDSMVTIDGITATLDTFESAGLAAKNDRGLWVVATDEMRQQWANDEKQRAEEAEPKPELLHPYQERVLGELIEAVPQPVYDSAIARYAETLDASKIDVSAIAHTSGISTEEAKARVTKVQEMFETQIKDTVGDNYGNVLKWANTHHTDDLKAAMRKMLMERNTEGFRKLAEEYQKDTKSPGKLERAARWLQKQGYDIRKDSKGGYVVGVEGRDLTPLDVAFKEGLLKWM